MDCKPITTEPSFDDIFFDPSPGAFRIQVMPEPVGKFDPGTLIVSAMMGTVEINVMDNRGRRMDVFIALAEARGLLFRLNRAIRDAEIQERKWETWP